MNLNRRRFLHAGVMAVTAVGSAMVWPLKAMAAAMESVFAAKNLEEVFKGLGTKPTPSDKIDLKTPDIAENGAVVPVSVKSKLPKTEQIMILVEKNPNPLAAVFNIPDGTDADISTRVKVGQTCDIYAVIMADGKLYSTHRETKVTLGGCGG